MLTDIEIAAQAKMKRITDVAAAMGIRPEELEPYGHYKAKLSDDLLTRLQDRPDGKLVLVTAVNPTPAGEGKTTVSIGLGQAMCKLGENAVIALREPSLGPVFGIKGGAAGGGYSQVVPMEDINLHYSDTYTDMTYNDVLVRACAESGIAAFTGDGTNPDVMTMATKAIGNADGCGVPTIKPWNIDTIKEKMAQAKASGCFAVAMDVDAAGLPFLKNMTPPAGSKSVAELAEIVKLAERPFIVKGVMTVKGALKAKEAGAAAIVVSNHGGRVLDQCPATAEVLPEIAAALKGTGVKVLVDGGIRTGVDVFKALALGADGVLICRPFVTAVYGGGAEGVKCYIDKLAGELADTMQMCGAHSIAEITPDMVRV